jgi:cellulose synthase/poly-beta-1,6-N-acetylglucosamine synthase-like glycosyltransferase
MRGGDYVLYLDDDNILEENCLEIMVNGFSSEEVGYVICPIKYGNTIMNPRPGFKHREVDLLNYMVRRKLIENVWGQNRHIAADYYLIDNIRQLAEGNYLEDIIGHHR